METETIDLTDIEIKIAPSHLDEDQFASVWQIASDTMDGELGPTRLLAYRFLGFLCKHRCGLVVVSASNAKYLDEWFERDNSLLYDWTPVSDKVDVITQYMHVPFDLFQKFLIDHKFKPTTNHSPRRADRVAWFTEDWNVE